ncbi:hypothetical protein [Microcystis aeruginosa]|nr:hypothetical protein [Microcystis aeruginosa]MDB9418907.1 hypothetical protein [Microcystis aeruginosa CS-556/03]
MQTISEEPVITLNIYGDTFTSKRFQFDPLTNRAVNFEVREMIDK